MTITGRPHVHPGGEVCFNFCDYRPCMTWCEAAREQYDLGFNDGARDLNIIQQPIKTNGHTEPMYGEVLARAESIYFSCSPTPYMHGYMDGADAVALCHKGEGGVVALTVMERNTEPRGRSVLRGAYRF